LIVPKTQKKKKRKVGSYMKCEKGEKLKKVLFKNSGTH
jgi:hypothetical protein